MSIIVSILDTGGSGRMLTVDHYEIIRRKVRDGMSQRDVAKDQAHLHIGIYLRH